MAHKVNNAGTYIISVFYFISVSNLFGVISINCVLASTKAYIIYWAIVKIIQDTSFSWILKDKNFIPISHAAMLGCRYAMVPTSALHRKTFLSVSYN